MHTSLIRLQHQRRVGLSLLTMIVALLLAACGGSPAESISAPTSAPAAVEATAAATATAPTAQPTAAAEATSEAALRTFEIISEQSQASYAVQETFLRQNLPNKAIGTTKDITGTFQFTTEGQPTAEVIQMRVDLRTLTSDSDRRDNAIRERWLESNTYPYAEFTSTEVQGAPVSYTEGQTVTFQLLGDMTIHDVTKPVTFDVSGKLEGDTVTGTATTQLKMSDFGFEPPNIAGVVSVQDDVELTIQFTAKEQES